MRKLMSALFALAVITGMSACGDDDDAATSADDMDESADDDMEGMAAEPDEEGDDHDGDHAELAFGEPADAADADRTIEVVMYDDYTYEPDSIDVAVDETVEFVVTNDGKVIHEFVIGDEAIQEEHKEEMAGMEAGMMMEDEPNGVAVEPGGTKSLTFHFTEPAELTYACHQPGHFDAGMEAPLTVS